MITITDYWMGREHHKPTDAIRANAEALVRRVRQLLELAAEDGISPAFDQVTKTHVSSGWRPPAINDRTANAAKGSAHLTGEAVDLQDHADQRLAAWCVRNVEHLDSLGLYMEDARWTGGRDPWVHLQTRPTRSGRRIFIPSTAAPSSPDFYIRHNLPTP